MTLPSFGLLATETTPCRRRRTALPLVVDGAVDLAARAVEASALAAELELVVSELEPQPATISAAAGDERHQPGPSVYSLASCRSPFRIRPS